MFGLTFGFALDRDTANEGTMLLFLSIGMALMGLTFGPMSAVLPELFPSNVRSTGSGISYNAASMLGAAIAPFIPVWLVREFGVAWVGVYLLIAAGLTLIAVRVMKETRNRDLDSV
ncbi:MFS transporter [Nakamurella sp. YIM 132084]|uniref:MFS transporter n=1 Tax=Nakamurella leprariae TaxID=2803911 RepID=A0A938YB90_9ACTN|nr:MFS transporter [Nakamurella leprariae]MBM9469305.1 MFS transporter [Nakamurella leprariae]